LKNNGTQAATGITVSAKLPAGMVHTSNNASKGVYNLFSERWDVPVLQPGETATLTLVLFALVNNTSIANYVQVTAQSQPDADSTPNNGVAPTPNEDDEAAVTLTANLSPSPNPDFAIGNPSNGSLGGTFTNVYPQPAGNDLTVEMTSDMEGAASVFIIDGRGKVVEKSSLQLSKGFNQLNLDISDLNSGMYYIIVDGLSAERLSKRFIVVK
jgi:hypothetical protein